MLWQQACYHIRSGKVVQKGLEHRRIHPYIELVCMYGNAKAVVWQVQHGLDEWYHYTSIVTLLQSPGQVLRERHEDNWMGL